MPNAIKKPTLGRYQGSTSAIGMTTGKSMDYDNFTVPIQNTIYNGNKKGSVVIEGRDLSATIQ